MEAIFLLRAYRTTLTRFGETLPIDTARMAVRRRISAAYKDLPGGQVLGPSYDYTHRLLDFALAAAIGRASCRVRVCQYVSVTVVAVALTKKKQIIFP